MEVTNSNNLEKDINDVFDSIAFSEEFIINEAFKEGLAKGSRDGKLEGYHLGFHRGLELGTELGFYKGLLQVLKENSNEMSIEKNEKVAVLIEKLHQLLEDFPENNSPHVDIIQMMEKIRANYRKLNSLLKLNLSFPVNPTMSF